jgi:arginine exporter protein ArgO
VTGALVAGAVAGYGIAVPVGAVGTYLVAVAARHGFRRGAWAALGVASADAVYACVAVLGGAVVAELVEPVARPLRLVSVGVLVAVALGIALPAVRERIASDRLPTGGPGRPAPALVRDRAWSTDGRAFGTFLGMTLLDPMTVVYFAALVLGGQGDLFASTGDRIAFVVAAAAASASWQLVLAGGGALLGRLVTSPAGRLATAVASSAVIVVLALRLL